MAADDGYKEVFNAVSQIGQRKVLASTDIEDLQKIVVASRESSEVRKALASEDVLQTLLDTLAQHQPVTDASGLNIAVLTCLGNALANNPDAAAFVAGRGLDWMHSYLTTSASNVSLLTSKVLYNLCAVDFEETNPAWKISYDSGLYLDIIDILLSTAPTSDQTPMLIDLLFWITSAKPTPEDGQGLAFSQESRLWPILNIQWFESCATALDVEDFATLVETVTSLLRAPNVRQAVVVQRLSLRILQMFSVLDRRLVMAEVARSVNADADESPQDVQILEPQATGFIWLLSDLTSVEDFGDREQPDQPTLDHAVQMLLQSRDNATTQRSLQAASLVIGNILLALPEADTIRLLKQIDVVGALLDAATKAEATPDLLHAAAGLLIVLSKPSISIREEIANRDEAEPFLRRLCLSANPPIRNEGMRALRALGKGSPAVQERFAGLIKEVESTLSQNAAAEEDAA